MVIRIRIRERINPIIHAPESKSEIRNLHCGFHIVYFNFLTESECGPKIRRIAIPNYYNYFTMSAKLNQELVDYTYIYKI